MPDNGEHVKHILAVNDDAAVLQLFNDLLSEAGYQVSLDSFNRSTTDLLDVVRTLQPDLVVMDFVIGGELKGWQFLQATQMNRATRDIPIVICTGAVNQVNELSGHLETRGVKVVIKPFDIDELLSVIDKVWESQQTVTQDSSA